VTTKKRPRFDFLRSFTLFLGRLFYRVETTGTENVPGKGGFILVCNHVGYSDAIPLSIACPRLVRFISAEGLFDLPIIGKCLKHFHGIPVSPDHATGAIRTAAAAAKEGDAVGIFPEGELTRSGSIQAVRPGFQLIARKADVPVVVAHLDGLWGSLFSFEREKYFFKWPHRLRFRIGVRFSKPIPPGQATPERIRTELLTMSAEAMNDRPQLHTDLQDRVIRGLKAKGASAALIDRGPGGKTLTGRMLLGAATTLAKKWRSSIEGHRVGILLPPGAAGTLANVATLLAGKVPVNLNPTAGQKAFASSLEQAELRTILTATAYLKRLPALSLPDDTRFIEKEISGLSKPAIALAAGLSLLPTTCFRALCGIRRQNPYETATLLFTSGSTGLPKGVPLSHRNIVANLTQFHEVGLFRQNETLLGCLPLFHCFGQTVGLWLPICGAHLLATTPSPLDAAGVARTIRETGVTILTGTPTLYRMWMRKAQRKDLETVRVAMAGAEKLPSDLAKSFREQFERELYEGYGLTETSPVISLNRPDPIIGPAAQTPQIAHRPGSVGRLAPGIAATILNQETGKPCRNDEVGMLYLRGANVFGGYLDNEKASDEVLSGGWFRSGDLARFDEDGFLFIEGRLSRFSKIGGEMVPHGTVEEAVETAFPDEGAGRAHAVVGIRHESKGEQLVLLTTQQLTPPEVRARLSKAGLPALWIPKLVRHVEAIPMLASGKLDLSACKELAESESTPGEAPTEKGKLHSAAE